ncbi:MAG: hypothetical protein NTZ78_14575 [Candidatus Aureabacteria bacterium]|nr:hypothetical protein [Candidatus Auribacterota bacterium]
MKKLLTIALSLLSMVCLSYTVIAGSLDSPGAPSLGSGMYTLQNLYDYLTSGTALTVQTSFQEPTSGPTTGTMKTTKEIGDAIKALLDQSTVTADGVKSGERFFCTQAGSWGVQTGTLIVPPTPTPTPTLTPTITPTPTPNPQQACESLGGYWASTQLAYPNDYACWFAGDFGASCSAVCAASPRAMQCAPGNWNDSAGADVCLHYHPTATLGSCISEDPCPRPLLNTDNQCDRRCAGTVSCTMASSGWARLCACVPQ